MKRLIIFLLAASALGARPLKNYAVDPTIKKQLDKNSDLLYEKALSTYSGSQKHGVWQFDWLPGYYVKYGLARIAGVEVMQNVINECGLDKVIVADKKVYHIKGRPKELSDLNYLVVVKAVKSAHSVKPITREEIEQLCTIMHKTGYISMTGPRCKKGPNYIRTPEGKFCLIDTESRYDHAQLLKGFIRMLQSHDFNKDLSEDALKYVLWEIKHLLKQQPDQTEYALNELKTCIKQQNKPHSWDYRRYFKNYFSDIKITN